MKDARRQRMGSVSGATLPLLLFYCVFMTEHVAGAAPAPLDHYAVSAVVSDTARVPDILKELDGVGCRVEGVTASDLVMFGERKETFIFSCLAKRRAVRGILKKFSRDKSLKGVKVVEDLVASRAAKLRKKLTPVLEEYEKNKELFKTLPIANALMLEALLPLKPAGGRGPAKAARAAMIDFSLIKRYPKGSPVPEDMVDLRDIILGQENNEGDGEYPVGIEDAGE